MKVKEIMKKNVKFCADTAKLHNVAKMMEEGDCGMVPVVDNKGELIGVITDRDIAMALASKNEPPSALLVRDFFTLPALTCGATDDIHVALETMRREKVRRLPVLDRNGHITGILSMDDVVLFSTKAQDHETELSYEDVVDTLKGIYRQIVLAEPEAARAKSGRA